MENKFLFYKFIATKTTIMLVVLIGCLSLMGIVSRLNPPPIHKVVFECEQAQLLYISLEHLIQQHRTALHNTTSSTHTTRVNGLTNAREIEVMIMEIVRVIEQLDND